MQPESPPLKRMKIKKEMQSHKNCLSYKVRRTLEIMKN